MKKTPYILDFNDEDKPVEVKYLLRKYLAFWPWFVLSIFLFLMAAFLYQKYATKTYLTEAKIKILDTSQDAKVIPKVGVNYDPNAKINLENHMEVLRSNQLLGTVVNQLDLDIEYFEYKDLRFRAVEKVPFQIIKNINEDAIDKPAVFEIMLAQEGYHIVDKTGRKYVVPYELSMETLQDILPFGILLREDVDVRGFANKEYKIVVKPKTFAIAHLVEDLKISTSEKQSDVISLSLKSESKSLSETTLNRIIANFDTYDVEDKQLITKRTLEVIDERFNSLAAELDAIEIEKKEYKVAENLSFLETDAGVSLKQKVDKEDEILKVETQISLLNLLERTVSNGKDNSLLPADIGLANGALNSMVEKYNELARERQKLGTDLNTEDPRLKNLSERLSFSKENIQSTINTYKYQLAITKGQLTQQKDRADLNYAALPEKERALRAIERQQAIKENLYLLLLKKREEAAIDYESTASSIKVIDYAISGIKPVWPKRTLVYLLAFGLGLLVPFLVLLLRSSFDSKIYNRGQIERLSTSIPTLMEIPFFGAKNNFSSVPESAPLAEAFRILAVNTDYMMPNDDGDSGKIIYVTSSIKKEGKTLIATNLSLAYASMGKRVLLVGADLRNPQLHYYTGLHKESPGLSDYLKNQWFSFAEGVQAGFEFYPTHKIFQSGKIPKSAPSLLSHKRFGEFIQLAKYDFDYVIVDTAPTMLVTDTLIISKYADVTLYVLRSGHTDKNLLQFSQDLQKNGKLNNMAYVLNGMGKLKTSSYNYGHSYGYHPETVKV